MSVAQPWIERLQALLPLYGHRNWIVVADSAYPAQSQPGIETIATESDQVDIVRHVFSAITASGHVRARVYVDHEIEFVREDDAPGVEAYRAELKTALQGAHLKTVAHEQVIAQLDEAAQMFQVLILKSTMTIPYTSVFFELDCGYWSAQAEERLREAITGRS